MGGLEIGARETIALMYHAVGDGTEPGADPHYTVGLPRLGEQLALCGQLGGGAISARDWLSGRAGVIVTFDDGHESNYRVAFPLLAASGATADFFVNPAQVGSAGFASWRELAEMAGAGMSIQCHGLDHRHYFTELPPERLRAELGEAKAAIEDEVGREVTLLAPPCRSPSRASTSSTWPERRPRRADDWRSSTAASTSARCRFARTGASAGSSWRSAVSTRSRASTC